MSKKISVWVPIYSSAKFILELPDNWDDMDDEGKLDYFYIHSYAPSLCHYCSHSVESNFEIDSSGKTDENVLEQLHEDREDEN